MRLLCLLHVGSGRFGSATGLGTSGCSGPCTAGFFCPPGSVTAAPAPCGNLTVFCPQGSGAPVLVPSGWYSLPEDAASATRRTGAVPCAAGEFCEGAVRLPCPAGTHTGAFGQVSCAPCPAGKSARLGRPSLGLVDAAHPSPATPPPPPCAARSAPAIRSCIRAAAAVLHCAMLYVLAHPCFARSGYACGNGTGVLSSGVHGCADPTAFCPVGSWERTPTPPGFFANPTPIGLYFNATRCAPGQYCVGGVAGPCPAGRYGTAPGLTNASCSGACRAGYLCPAGSTSATAYNCSEGPGFYCQEVGPALGVLWARWSSSWCYWGRGAGLGIHLGCALPFPRLPWLAGAGRGLRDACVAGLLLPACRGGQRHEPRGASALPARTVLCGRAGPAVPRGQAWLRRGAVLPGVQWAVQRGLLLPRGLHVLHPAALRWRGLVLPRGKRVPAGCAAGGVHRGLRPTRAVRGAAVPQRQLLCRRRPAGVHARHFRLLQSAVHALVQRPVHGGVLLPRGLRQQPSAGVRWKPRAGGRGSVFLPARRGRGDCGGCRQLLRRQRGGGASSPHRATCVPTRLILQWRRPGTCRPGGTVEPVCVRMRECQVPLFSLGLEQCPCNPVLPVVSAWARCVACWPVGLACLAAMCFPHGCACVAAPRLCGRAVPLPCGPLRQCAAGGQQQLHGRV
jgi:hypothetical protein